MDSTNREERVMEWDLGLRGAAYLLAMSLAFGVVLTSSPVG
jgi:hypothetical protein